MASSSTLQLPLLRSDMFLYLVAGLHDFTCHNKEGMARALDISKELNSIVIKVTNKGLSPAVQLQSLKEFVSNNEISNNPRTTYHCLNLLAQFYRLEMLIIKHIEQVFLKARLVPLLASCAKAHPFGNLVFKSKKQLACEQVILKNIQTKVDQLDEDFLSTTRTARFTDFLPKQLDAIYKKVSTAERELLSALCSATAEFAKDNKKGLASILDVICDWPIIVALSLLDPVIVQKVASQNLTLAKDSFITDVLPLIKQSRKDQDKSQVSPLLAKLKLSLETKSALFGLVEPQWTSLPFFKAVKPAALV